MSVTETKNGIATTKTNDASGALISVTDPGGTITYKLRPDGQPSVITAPGSVETKFTYDEFGRQRSIDDPSAGKQSYSESYGSDGAKTEIIVDARNNTVTTVYDNYGRIKLVTRPEFSTDYVYNSDGQLTNETSTNGTSAAFTYDTYGRVATTRENIPYGKYLQKIITYSGGNISSVQYASQNGSITTENFYYSNGHNTEIKLNGVTSIWKLTEENSLGQPTKATTGTLARTYSYTAFGMPTGRTAGTIQNFSYSFDVATGNLTSRTDNTRGKTESFGYDNLNRLSLIGTLQVGYAPNGNITTMPGVGTFEYGKADRPYQVTMLTPTGTAVPVREQIVSYTSYQRPSVITENGITASFSYNAGGDRVKMEVVQGATALLTRYYISNQYELDAQTSIERLYLGGDAYSAPAVYVKEGGIWNIYYICRDYLGSITHIANANSSLKAEYSYDAWGRLRNPVTHVAYAPGTEPALFLARGYTGHEQLPWFGLINMNARLYDPALGRFLSPDPYVQAPDFTQNFNRYSYCLNNPLIYSDPSGEFIHILIGAAIGGVINLGVKLMQGKIHTFGDGLMAFGIGAVAGGIGAATGGGAFLAAGGGAAGAGGFLAGASGGIFGSAFGSQFQSIGNSLYFGDPLMSFNEFVTGIAVGGLTGGVINGSMALGNGKSFFTGDIKGSGITFRPRQTLKFDTEVKLNVDAQKLPIKALPNENESGIFYLENAKSAVKYSDGVPSKIIRDPNFRKNLISVSGMNPGKAAHAHHVFPLEYSVNFNNAGINPNSYGAWWGSGHIKNAYNYNQAWSSFFRSNPGASQSKIFEEALKLKNLFGY